MFFESSLTESSPFVLTSETLKVFYIQNVVLIKGKRGRKANVYIEYKEKKYKICSLKIDEQEEFSCNYCLKIDKKKKQYRFIVEGDNKAKISLIGFYEYEEGENELNYNNKHKQSKEKHSIGNIPSIDLVKGDIEDNNTMLKRKQNRSD